jgi:hypothetical protein
VGSAHPAAAHRAGRLDLDLPGRKSEHLRAVAEAALDGLLDGAVLRALDPSRAIQRMQQVKGSARSPPSWSSAPDWLQSEGSGSGPPTGSWG